MFATLVAKAPTTINTHDTWHDFITRLQSNHARLIVCIIVIVVVAGMVQKLNPGLGILAGLGSGWVTWYIYNTFSGWRTPLFIGERRPSRLWDLLFANGWAFLAALIALAAGVWTFHVTKGGNVLIRVIAGIGVWAALLLIYTILFVQILRIA